jgi:fluoroquinolone transport system ATP-binding protein
MKSRLNFIKALMHDPRILFLDEPTSGLDPSNSRVVKDLILEEKSKGKTIILTTIICSTRPSSATVWLS